MYSTIGRFEVGAQLGRGGSARVYRAYDPVVGRSVAIKMMTAAADKELVELFQTEIHTIAKLSHKNIVTLHESGTEQGLPYMVMELIEGQPLQDALAKELTLSLYEKVNVMMQVAEGMQFAHQKKVVHGDLKPGNIMVIPGGGVKIIDFGVAHPATQSIIFEPRSGLVGTIPYMAPEQLEGSGIGKATVQTDVFAYGVMFYELLTGKHPFNLDDDILGIVERIRWMSPEPVTSLFPECPETLADLISQAISKDLSVRYSSFSEILLDIEAIRADIAAERATTMLEYVPALIEEGNISGARSILKGVIRLEPSNVTARRLRKAI
jgi:serine/threonine protein kinase